MTTANVQIYGPEFSNFVRSVSLICEENGINYSSGWEINGEKVEYKSEEHIALHPYGKMPVLVDGDTVIPETTAICQYLLAKHTDENQFDLSDREFAQHNAFCAIVSIYIDKAILRDYLLEFVFPKGEEGQVRLDVVQANIPEVEKALEVVEHSLKTENFLNKEKLTIVDALLAPILHYLSGLPAPFNIISKYPVATAYLDKLMSRSSCQKLLTAKNLG